MFALLSCYTFKLYVSNNYIDEDDDADIDDKGSISDGDGTETSGPSSSSHHGSDGGGTEASISDGDGSHGTESSGRSSPQQQANDRSAQHAQAVLEIVETEISYGKDLAVLKHVRRRN